MHNQLIYIGVNAKNLKKYRQKYRQFHLLKHFSYTQKGASKDLPPAGAHGHCFHPCLRFLWGWGGV